MSLTSLLPCLTLRRDVESKHTSTSEEDEVDEDEAEAEEKSTRGSRAEYVHIENIRDHNGNWVIKRLEDPLDDDDEFAPFSFTVLRDWEWDGNALICFTFICYLINATDI